MVQAANPSPSRHVEYFNAVPSCCSTFRKAAGQSSVRVHMVPLHNSVVMWKPVSAGGLPYWLNMGCVYNRNDLFIMFY